FRCPRLPPTLENTTLVTGVTDHQAVYHCDVGLTFSDRQTVKYVSCNSSTLQWDDVADRCKIHKTFETQVCLARFNHSVSDAFAKERWTARGVVDCVQQCMFQQDCVSFSFTDTIVFGEATNCITSNVTASNITALAIAMPGWNLYSLNGDC
ncbi:hypothetical protein ElyMa_003048400, partial [Elysia marginata]